MMFGISRLIFVPEKYERGHIRMNAWCGSMWYNYYYRPVHVYVLSNETSADDSLSFARLLLPAATTKMPCSTTQQARSSL